MSIPTEEQFNGDAAAEIVVLLNGVNGNPELAAILDDEGNIRHEVDRNLAITLAERLLHVAQMLPDSPRILRRASDVDDHLRALDG